MPHRKLVLQHPDVVGHRPGKLVFDAKRQAYYVVAEHEVLRFDPKAGALTRVHRTVENIVDILYAPTVDRLFVLTSYRKLFMLDPARKHAIVRSWKAGGRPQRMAFDSATKRLFVTNGRYDGKDAAANVVMVYDLKRARAVATIRVGFAPHFVALDSPRHELLTTSYDRVAYGFYRKRRPNPPGYLARIDTRTLAIKKKVPLQSNPSLMVYHQASRTLILEDKQTGELSSMDVDSGREQPLSIDEKLVVEDVLDGTYEPRDKSVRLLVERNGKPRLVVLAPGDPFRLVAQHAVGSVRDVRGAELSPGSVANEVWMSHGSASKLYRILVSPPSVENIRTGTAIRELAVHEKRNLLFALDPSAGDLFRIDTRTGALLSRLAMPAPAKQLFVDEPTDVVVVVSDDGYEMVGGKEKIRKVLTVLDPVGKRVLEARFRTQKYRYNDVGDVAFDAKKRRIFLIFDARVREVALRDGKQRELAPAIKQEPRAIALDAAGRRLLVMGRTNELALYDADTFALIDKSEIDEHNSCGQPTSARQFHGFDRCTIIFEHWPANDAKRLLYKVPGLAFADAFVPDPSRGRALMIRRKLVEFGGPTYAPTRTAKLSWLDRNGVAADIGREATFAVDRKNRILFHLTRGAFKSRSTPQDFRKELNHLFTLNLDDKRVSIVLSSRVDLPDQPSGIALDTKQRHAFISHAAGSYLTMLRY